MLYEVDELKSCPFCGGEALIDKWSMIPWEVINIPDNDGYWYAAFCNECLSEGSNCIGLKEAVEAWNKRVDGN